MDLILDANVLFSAILRDGTSAALLFAEGITLYAPEFLFEELAKYQEMLMRRTDRTASQFSAMLGALSEIIHIVPKEEYQPFITTAMQLSPDPNDAMYFALALKLRCAIWSNDKQLNEQDRVRIISTTALVKLLSS